jgi:hypothetical protein
MTDELMEQNDTIEDENDHVIFIPSSAIDTKTIRQSHIDWERIESEVEKLYSEKNNEKNHED